jgi:hypothetical protein
MCGDSEFLVGHLSVKRSTWPKIHHNATNAIADIAESLSMDVRQVAAEL